MENISLASLASGAIEERFQQELNKILENIFDPNTEATAKRSISIGISFKPNKNRTAVEIETSITSKGAKYVSVESSALIGLENGEYVAREFQTGQIPGQMSIENFEEEKEEVVNNVTKLGFKKANNQ